MDKVRQVGESYELNKYKTLNRTVELDARLANERLLATKLRLNQVSKENEQLAKQLRLAQSQCREFEKRLLVSETVLRQLVGGGGGGGATLNKAANLSQTGARLEPTTANSRTATGSSKSSAGRLVRFGVRSTGQRRAVSSGPQSLARRPSLGAQQQVRSASSPPPPPPLVATQIERRQGPAGAAASGALGKVDLEKSEQQQQSEKQQQRQRQQASRTRMIISDLKQKLSLSSGSSRARARQIATATQLGKSSRR